jgi:hypothetical protein
MQTRDRRTPAGPNRARGSRLPRILAAFTLLASVFFTVPAATAGATATSSASAAGASPIDFVVLVDESGSIQQSEMNDERAAAALLTQSEISPTSRAAVIGFGSSNAPGESPVDPVCPLTVLDTAGRAQMSTCVNKLTGRTQAQGWDTDFNSAISQALSTLAQDPAQVPKLIFMLTDGIFDVHNSPQYGADATDRMANGAKALTETLQNAAAQQVEIWPLGFGDQVDGNELATLAAGGYQPTSSCSAHPQAHTVSSSSVVFSTLLEAFAGARCGNEDVTGSANFTKPQSFTVTIPAVASEGSILVLKRDPSAVVTFHDPEGRVVGTQASAYGSTFEVSGQNTPVESLRITDPVPGAWTVDLSDPAGYDGQQVMAAIVWQGTLRSFITVSPPAPYAGERVTVRVRLQTHAGVVLHDPSQLAGISVSATLTGTGVSGLTVPLNDAGAAPDTTAYDGQFSGYLTVPKTASGSLTLVGDVTGKGVVGDQRPVYLTVQSAPPLLTGTISMTTHQINPGGAVSGTLLVRNTDGKAHTVAFELSELDTGEQAEVVPATITVPAASQQQYKFSVEFGSGTPLGFQPGVVTAVDKTAAVPVDDGLIDVQIVPLPDFWQQWKTLLLAGTAVLAGLIALLIAQSTRRKRGLRFGPVTLRLLTAAGTEATRLKTVKQTEFGFILAPSGGSAKLRRQNHGARWTVRRERPRGGLQLIAPDGRAKPFPPNRQIPLEGDFEIELIEKVPGPSPTPGQPTRRGDDDWDTEQHQGAQRRPTPGSGWDDNEF